MKITFENMREPVRLSGVSTNRLATSARNMRTDSVVLFPSGSIPRRAPLKSKKISTAAVNILMVAGAFAFTLITALSITAGFFLLLFVKT